MHNRIDMLESEFNIHITRITEGVVEGGFTTKVKKTQSIVCA